MARDKFIKIRVDATDRAALEAARVRGGYATLSDLIRSLSQRPPHLTALSRPGPHAPGQPQET